VVSAPARKPETVLAAPVVRKLAREMDVDLNTVTGTGPGGQITAEDVRTAKVSAGLVAPTPRPMVTGDVRVPFRGVRRKIAEHMLRTQREVAQFTYMEEVDATELVELRGKAEARLASHDVKLSYLPFFIRAAVDALKKQPQLNAYLDERAGEIVQRHEYHIGLAAQTPEGLMVPVIRHAERRSLLELAREVERLAMSARTGHVSPADLGGSTFTITSLGALGGLSATPIINYPEVAILAVHKIAKRPAVVDDKIVIREMMNLSLSVDHRMVDGHDAARFVAEIKASLETPGLLFLESY
jgi:pyruvate dehydrogenase E2 component (dihydrolipoamide acetyltransferase)